MNDIITLKLCKQDKEFLQQEAKKQRLTLSAYVRTKMLAGNEDSNVREWN